MSYALAAIGMTGMFISLMHLLFAAFQPESRAVGTVGFAALGFIASAVLFAWSFMEYVK